MRNMREVDPEGWKSSTRARNVSDHLLYNSSPVYNSDSDISYSNPSIPAGLISLFPIAEVSTFQPLAEDGANSEEPVYKTPAPPGFSLFCCFLGGARFLVDHNLEK